MTSLESQYSISGDDSASAQPTRLVEQTSLTSQRDRPSVVLLPDDQLLSMTQEIEDESERDDYYRHNDQDAQPTHALSTRKPKSGDSIAEMVEQDMELEGKSSSSHKKKTSSTKSKTTTSRPSSTGIMTREEREIEKAKEGNNKKSKNSSTKSEKRSSTRSVETDESISKTSAKIPSTESSSSKNPKEKAKKKKNKRASSTAAATDIGEDTDSTARTIPPAHSSLDPPPQICLDSVNDSVKQESKGSVKSKSTKSSSSTKQSNKKKKKSTSKSQEDSSKYGTAPSGPRGNTVATNDTSELETVEPLPTTTISRQITDVSALTDDQAFLSQVTSTQEQTWATPEALGIRPGAIRIHGIDRLSMRNSDIETGLDDEDEDDDESEGHSHASQTAATSRSGEPTVAVAVTRDDLEEEVRRRILSETVTAQVVPAVLVSESSGPSRSSNGGARSAGYLHSDKKTRPIIDSTYVSQGTDSTPPPAVQVQETSGGKFGQWSGGVICVAILVAVFLVGGTIIGLLVGLMKNDKSPPFPTTMPGLVDESDLSMEGRALLAFLRQRSVHVDTIGSPQNMAFDWLVENEIFSGGDTLLELFALCTFYFSTQGDNWSDSTGWLDASVPVCDWYPGTLCEEIRIGWEEDDGPPQNPDGSSGGESHVVKSLNLPNNNLVGTIPEEIELLTELFGLYLNGNTDLVGSLPGDLGNLYKLQYFDVSECSLTGTFPPHFELVIEEQLRLLKMENVTTMTGDWPRDAFRSRRLRVLNLQNMGLRGKLPPGKVGPAYINLSGNKLIGPLGIGQGDAWADVIELDLSFNYFTGTIPSALGMMWRNGSLISLQLQGNDFDEREGGQILDPYICESFNETITQEHETRTFVADCAAENFACPCCTQCCEHGGMHCYANHV